MEELLSMLPRGLKVLDVPFGTGRFVNYYHDHGYTVFGLDASDDIMMAAQTSLGDQYDRCTTVRGYSTKLPFDDKAFDLVVSTRFLRDIICYADTKKTIREFARVCKSYAILQLGFRVDGPYEFPADDERMGSRMSRRQVLALLKRSGFEEVESRKVKVLDGGNAEIHHFLLRQTST
nr:class I SAM-dependent methyltransferase [Ruegeria sp. R13_0]